MPPAPVALVTDAPHLASADPTPRVAELLHDDMLLADALAAHGLAATRVDWADAAVDWSRFRGAVLRTTWNYPDRPAAFSAWLDHVAARTQLLNVPGLVRWNLDKHYLADLAARGVPIVATRFLERGTAVSLPALLREQGWADVVVKPAISAGARHTWRIDAATAAAHDPLLAARLAEEAMLLQPFEPGVVTHGEVSVIVLDGRCTHAVSKRPRTGDFRVQSDFGGTVAVHPASPAEQAFAEAAVAACTPAPLYARVDMVRTAAGPLALMEIELIEPELWLRLAPESARVFAAGIARALGAAGLG